MVQRWNETNLVDASGSPISVANPIPAQVVNQVGIVSTLNSTTTPLSAGGSYLGTFEETLRWSHIVLTVYTDVPSLTDGLTIEWSTDGIHIDDDDIFTVPGDNGKVYTFGPEAKYYRVRYINGSSPQSEFRLSVLLKPVSQKASSHRIKDKIISDDDAELCKSVLTGEDDHNPGIFNNVKVDHRGRLITSGFGTILFNETWLNNVIDTTEKWTLETIGNGSYTLSDGIFTLSTGTGSVDEQELFSKQVFQLPLSNQMNFITQVKFGDNGKTNNYRLFGIADGEHEDNGYLFALVGSSFYARLMYNGNPTDTDITPYFPTDGAYHNYVIHSIDGIRAEFWVDDENVAIIKATNNMLVATKNLGIIFHNQNTGITSGSSTMSVGGISFGDEGKSAIQLIGASSSSPTMLVPVQVDSLGRLVTASSASLSGASSGILSYDVTSKGPLVTNIWERLITYPVPTGKTFNLIQFQSAAANNTQISRCIRQIIFGTKNYATSFTSSNSLTAPQFASRLYALVTTTHSATTTVLTATYVNQNGVGGRTATTATIPVSAPANTMYEFLLQAGDYGVQSISSVTHTNTLTGNDSIIGIDELGYHRDKNADIVTESIVGGQAIIVNSGTFGTIGLDFNSTNTIVARLIKALFFLSNT